ncbi:MAG TPA: aspartate kinase, partial [Nitrosopumilus sp.]|nr:aspartate kinase [Nitrosopumilus sp.]
MKLVIKYGGTSISSAKDITAIAKYLNSLSTKNQIVVVCSAMSGTTDDLIGISESIKKENKLKGEQLASKIINRHKQLAKQTIKKSDIRKKLLTKLDQDFVELLALIDGMVLLGEVTPRSMDYLISFGERLSIKLVSSALNDSGKKSIPLTGKEVG